MDTLAKGRYLRWLAWPTLMVAAFVGASYASVLIINLLNYFNVGWSTETPTGALGFRMLIYLIMLVAVVALPIYVFKHRITLRDAGLARLATWTDLGLSVAAMILYVIIAMVVVALASQIPIFNANEAQDVGLNYIYGWDKIIAFVVLVVITPVVEEVLFRGILFGKLRQQKLPLWLSAVVVSALFGLAHGQWNVGLDAFCLSMVLCYLRAVTGSIWAGIFVHMIKNGIAFYFTFVIFQGL